MVVGVAFSGGGITALLATVCALKSLTNETSFETYSTVSGGSMGLTLYDSVGDALWVPDYEEIQAMQTGAVDYLSKRHTSSSSSTWFASVLDFVPNDPSFESLLEVLKDLGILDKIIGKDNWWKLALESVIEEGIRCGCEQGKCVQVRDVYKFRVGKRKILSSVTQ